MDFSLFYFANDSRQNEDNRYDLLLQGASFADQHGFTAVWTPERHFHAFGGLYPNPSVTAAAIAATTERVAIRAGSVVGPLHHPLRIAEEWSVVDNISRGRVGVAFASGWHSRDFVLSPGNYSDRKRLMLERVDEVRRLWRGEQVGYADGAGNVHQVGVFPPPIQPELPVWMASKGSAETFRDAGRIGAGVLTFLLQQDLDQLRVKISEYRKSLSERAGSNGRRGHVTLMVHTFLGKDEDEVRETVRAPMYDYLESSLGLKLGHRRDIDSSALSATEAQLLVARSFERYFDGGALFGTVAKAREKVAEFAAAGVDEVACLIDFGLPNKTVLEGLEYLDVLRRSFADTASG